MTKLKFSEGDWCFCNFKLQQIQEIEYNDRKNKDVITCVSDGLFRHGGSDLNDRCFPLTLPIKNASDSVAWWESEFHKIKNSKLNYPDLNNALITRWVSICQTIDDKQLTQQKYDDLSKFGNAVMDKINNMDTQEVEGVKVFR